MALTGAVAGIAGLAVAAPAGAYEIKDFSANIFQADGTTFESQAGAVPHTGVIAFNTVVTTDASSPPIVEQGGSTRNIQVTTPPGLTPNPESIPECTDDELHDRTCPTASQIGMVELRLRSYLPPTATTLLSIPVGTKGWLGVKIPLYNMERSTSSQLARFAFDSSQAPNATTGHVTEIIGAMRPDDNRLFFTISDIVTPTSGNPTQPLLAGSTLTFWGKPNAASHNAERGFAQLRLISTDAPGQFPGPPNMPSPPFPPAGTPIPANAPVNIPLGQTAPTGAAGITNPNATFLRSPTSCAGPQKAQLELTSWQGAVRNADYLIGEETDGLQGCDQVPFASSTEFGPSAMQADSPVPLGVTLNVPQAGDDDPIATAHVKDVAVKLPPGMTISPSAANGLEACLDAQFAKGTNDPIACPAASKIGSVRISTPVLPEALTGSVYVGQPLPGNRYRLFLNADGFGISIRLKGEVRPNPATGQVTAYFNDNPQLPFSQFQLDFDGGSKAIIASPPTCGTHTGVTAMHPWSGNAADVTRASVQVSAGCLFPFAPGFEVRPSTLLSGAQSHLSVDLTRHDGHQNLMGVEATLPAGMVATLKGVQRCNEAQVAAEACPGGSQIGIVSVKAGPGAHPFALSAPVYLTGAYNNGSFGAVVIMRVIAGPYDLGNVVVRQSIRIDPDTARVTVHSDPLPQIVEGVPLRLRDLQINVTRNGFMRNPTSCGGKQVDAKLSSSVGGVSTPAARLSFDDCKKLKFEPKISLRLGHKSQMRKFKYPALRATVTQGAGEAGIRSSQVILPKHVALAAKNAKGLCEVAQARADKCPEESVVGHAVAQTPLLDKDLKGPVFFVKGERTDPKSGRVIATLPTLYVKLQGETTIKLRATTDVSKDRLVTTFAEIPDAPISRFTLTIKGGKNGIIQATRDLCKAKAFKGTVRFGGQNDVRAKTAKPRISTACSSKKAS
ncbi:MAG: hypothetical protein ITG02_00280 [Patulibacter sp.]|nr:hypothetical protein [Patulibacter sp.]